jgi:2-keto-4-pentenoate hydratase/2-oxohepta-3-ene-1,7-dioic acid hydratase in catechol pathway
MLIGRAETPDGVVYGQVDKDSFLVLAGDPFTRTEYSGREYPLDSVRLVHPVEPRRVLVVLGGFLPEGQDAVTPGSVPRLFPKVVTEHLGPDAVIPYPEFLTSSVDMEAELALVIGRRTRGASAAEGWESIFGFTVYNDVSASEFVVERDFYRAKSIDGFSSFGPWVSTDISRDDIRDGLAILGRVNGEERQRGITSRFKFDPGQVVSEASRYVTLLPGDVISLGTPPPAQPVQRGDRIQAEVEGIGVLNNVIG